MSKLWCACSLAALLVASLPAAALDRDGAFFVRGAGNERCAAYLAARHDSSDAEFQAWLAGYVSAFNRWTADVWDIEASGDFDASLHWVDLYCSVHPRASFGTAVENLIAFLYPTRQRAPYTTTLPGASAGSSLPPR
jgi:hypothetical protein